MSTRYVMDNVVVSDPKLTICALRCDENKTAFGPLLENKQVLRQARVSLKWLTKEEMLTALPPSPQTKQVYVIPRFDVSNPVYEHLNKLKHMMWGSPVIAYCSQKEMPLPDKPRELYSLAFKDVAVSFTGILPEIRDAETKRIELMGGTVLPDFSMNVDLLIASNCEATPKYRGAFCWKKPICHLRMIDVLWRDGSRHVNERVSTDYNEFAIPILTDCIISVSGIEMNERNAIGGAIEENGGRYVSDMEKGVCTHLITDKTSGDKYKFAIRWQGIRIVTTRWLRKCLIRNMRLPEEYYHPDPALRKVVSRSGTDIERQNIVPETQRKPAMPAMFTRPLFNPIDFGSFNSNMSGPLESTAIDAPSNVTNPNFDMDQPTGDVALNNDANMKLQIGGNAQNNHSKMAEDVDTKMKKIKIEDVSAKAVKIEEVEMSINALQSKPISAEYHTPNASSVSHQNMEGSHCLTYVKDTSQNVSVTSASIPIANVTYDVSRPAVGDKTMNNEETIVNEQTVVKEITFNEPAAISINNQATVNERTKTCPITATLEASHRSNQAVNKSETKELDATELEDGELEESSVVENRTSVSIEQNESANLSNQSNAQVDSHLFTANELSDYLSNAKNYIPFEHSVCELEVAANEEVSTAESDSALESTQPTEQTTQRETTQNRSVQAASTRQELSTFEASHANTIKKSSRCTGTTLNSTKIPEDDSTSNWMPTHETNRTKIPGNDTTSSWMSKYGTNGAQMPDETIETTTKDSTTLNESTEAEVTKLEVVELNASGIEDGELDETNQTQHPTFSSIKHTSFVASNTRSKSMMNANSLVCSTQHPKNHSTNNFSLHIDNMPIEMDGPSSIMEVAAHEEVETELEDGELLPSMLEEGELEATVLEEGELEATNVYNQSLSKIATTSKPAVFARTSHAPQLYMAGGKNPVRRMRLRINTTTWHSQLLDKTTSSGHNESDHEESQGDETLKPEFIKEMLSKAAQKQSKNAAAPLSSLNESQVPEDLRHCYRKTAFPPPQFSPMSIDDKEEFGTDENRP